MPRPSTSDKKTLAFLQASLPACVVSLGPRHGTKEWHALRRTGVGGSEIGALMGLSKWAAPMDVWLDKLGHVSTRKATLPMRQGQAMEPLTLEELEYHLGMNVIPCAPFSMQAKDHPLIRFNADGIVVFDDSARGDVPLHVVGGAEAKWTSNPEGWGESGGNEYPADYYLQCQHGMAATGLETWHLAAMLPRGEMRFYVIQRDEVVVESIIETVERFWQDHVVPKIPPPVDYSHPMAVEHVRRLFPGVTDEEITLGDGLAPAAKVYQRCSAIAKRCEKRKEAAKAELLAGMGEAKAGWITGLPNWRLVRTPTKGSTFTVTKKDGISFSIKEIKG